MLGIFDYRNFMPHGHCYLWRPDILWLNVLSDAGIGLAYMSIPFALVYVVRRRRELEFNWIFYLFAAFIFGCGLTHFMEIYTVWVPVYGFGGIVKMLTAVVSIATAIGLWWLIPHILAMPTKEMYEAERASADEMRITSRLKDEFIATLSHELRTPLNVIIGYSDILSVEKQGTTEFNQALEAIGRNARLQAELVNDLLDISRIINGKLVLEEKPVCFASCVENAINSIRLPAQTKDITTEKSILTRKTTVGDPTRLQQVVWNLLSNAVKFTPKGGRIKVTLKETDDCPVLGNCLELIVCDTGQGIPPDFLPHVFDRFKQYDSSLTRKHGGLGLGLAISKQLVEMHGGTITAHSKGPGSGSEFVVKLGLGHPQKTEVLETKTIMRRLDGIKVLLVDDEPDTRMLGERILARAGASVRTAPSVASARMILDEWEADVLVSDLSMPNESGFDLLRHVRSLKGTLSKIPAAAFTALAKKEDGLKIFEAGFQAHIAKPVDSTKLIDTIWRLATGSR